jgi:gastric triacylglycerol lipase
MGEHDLPTVFKYIFSKTNKIMHYVGHSQGTVQMFIALATQNSVVEQYLDKYFAFGPVVFLKNSKSHLIDLLDKSGLLEWYKLNAVH